jgi:hypothetical protein
MTNAIPANIQQEANRSHLNRIFELLGRLGGKPSPADTLEEDVFRVREGFHNFRLEAVEKSAPDIDFTKTPRPDNVELVYFARMMQRTQMIGHFVHQGTEVPVHYAITGAIVLKREHKRFHVWSEPELRRNVLIPFAFVKDPSLLADFANEQEFYLVDTGNTRPEYTQHRIAAVRTAREITMELRARLYNRWRKQEGSDLAKYILISGMVSDVPNADLSPNFVATARRVYVPWQNAEILEPHLLTPPYHRGALLKSVNTEGSDPMPKYTWYVRMRGSAKADPEFGLLRCTCVAKDDAEAVERVNALTARLLDERLPVTFPAETWDRLIFPLKLCRDYLDSLVPSRDTIKSYFARS